MAITKLLLFIIGLASQHYGGTAPNVPPPTEQLREQRGAERLLPWFIASHKTLVWSWAFLEGSVLVALSKYCPPSLTYRLLHLLFPAPLASSPHSLIALTAPTPAFVVGTLLAFTGMLLRAHCYRMLGQHFTFELSIRPAHALVTHGAYGVVRHPSYTGGLTIWFGWLLCVLDPQGVVVAVFAGAFGTRPGEAMVTGVLACMLATGWVMMAIGASKRMDKEDAMLERNFGEVWRTWVKKVPCRLVPGVY